jgi:hypothetical protein
VKFYRAVPVNTIPAGQSGVGDAGHTDVAAGLPGVAPLLAIRVADLVSPAGRIPASPAPSRCMNDRTSASSS